MKTKLETHKKTAVIVGGLFLTAMVTSLVGAGMIEPVLSDPQGLAALAENQMILVAGVLLELVNAVAVVGIATLMFPVLRKHTEVLAVGYVGIRLIEAAMQIIGDMIPLTLLDVSRGTLTAGAAELAALDATSTVWIAARGQLIGTMLGIFFSLGALLFYTALVQSRLVPRWLSVWGLVGAVLILAWNLSGIFGLELSAGLVLALPMILNEIILGIWLIVKGFEPAAFTSGTEKQIQPKYVQA